MTKHLRVYKTGELDPDGVTPVWKWECSHWACMGHTADKGYALFWENAIRGANYHLIWHRMNADA